MLYLVALPIGNLGDVTFRVRDTLAKADIILAEDTRKAGLLLRRLGIEEKTLLSFYEHNESKRIPYVVKLLREGREIALVSSAGTPLISDPGYRLVRKCIEEGLRITSCPGPSAVINALLLSGLAPDKFLFLGFLPRRKKRREKIIAQALKLPYTLIIFESPRRLKNTLEEVASHAQEERECVVAREMTKVHEEVIRGSIGEIRERLEKEKVRGEVVVLIERRKKEV